jgi:hypothetical protein
MKNVQVIGVKDTLRELRYLDPELRKTFNRDAKEVARPIIDKAKGSYRDRYLSGMFRTWSQRGRRLFPYSQAEAQKGVVFKIDTGKRATSVLTVIQKNPAAAILDMAGKNPGQEGRSRDFIAAMGFYHGKPSRVMWPAAESAQDEVQSAMIEIVNKAANEIQLRITVL